MSLTAAEARERIGEIEANYLASDTSEASEMPGTGEIPAPPTSPSLRTEVPTSPRKGTSK